jgi:hypothetical protein
MNFLGLDWNCECRFCDPAKRDFVGAIDELRQAGVCSADAASSIEHLPPLRHPLSGRVQSEVMLVPGLVSVHGLRAVELSGEPSGSEPFLRMARSAARDLPWTSTLLYFSEFFGACCAVPFWLRHR